MQMTHEHHEIQRTLKRFIDDEVNPHVDEWEAAEEFPAHEVFKGLGQLGLLGLTKPEKYGGMALDYSFSVAMAETLGHVHCGGVPMAIGVQTDMATPALTKNGSDELREEFLKPSISGDYVACLGVSEAGAGSDVASIKTTAKAWAIAIQPSARGPCTASAVSSRWRRWVTSRQKSSALPRMTSTASSGPHVHGAPDGASSSTRTSPAGTSSPRTT